MSLFYIKPQPSSAKVQKFLIVLCLFSTSNHNATILFFLYDFIVLCLFSTSNHNAVLIVAVGDAIVLCLFSTSNHNTRFRR